ncbi:dTMP kinase [Kiritimatiella glycovorans]|uniref:Thymidylate kinase n=1 Tax=Kiritimatiella glycovorans TaxID=1307763 RepID=A0A0G3EE10_9BACT|nr:dTMP kinase [Kiritimatiella glycovorans]AKJ64696.1 Thymidylate kinase [Kiritimatiella glycovorans]
MKTGRFITFEGPEGGGKTTQARRLVASLQDRGLTVRHVREPGGTEIGEAIRELLQHRETEEAMTARCEVLLFAASRAQLAARVIGPALERGEWVVGDRYLDSTTVYQGPGRGLSADALDGLNRFAVAGVMPDLTLLLDLPAETGMARLEPLFADGSSAPDRIEREPIEFHRRIREGYLDLARGEPGRFRVIDASAPPEEVFATLWREISDTGWLP